MNIQAIKDSPQRTHSCLQPLQWVDKYADYLYAFAMTRVQHDEYARDLVQETFLAGLERKHSFENRSSEKTWLTSILKNKICDLYLRLSKYPVAQEIPPDPFFRKSDGHWNPRFRPVEFSASNPDSIEAKEFNAVLDNCIKKLPTTWMMVFAMRHLQDCKASTICRQLNLTSSNFWVIIHRAKVNLRACLQRNL